MEGQYSEKMMEYFKNPRNVGEIPDASGIGNVGNPVCVPDNTLINCNNSVDTIKNIESGRRVLGHDGRYHKVSRIFRRLYSGFLLNFRVHSLGAVSSTIDHHVFAVKTSPFSHKFYASKGMTPDWYRADELKKGDLILYPIPKDEVEMSSMLLAEPKPAYDFKSKDLPDKIVLDENFLRLVGYYLAEGYVRTDKCKGTVGFVFNAKETVFINDVIESMKSSFGLELSSKRTVRNATDIQFYSARTARFFARNFGKGALNKKIPHEFLLLPSERQKALICGLWRGDGYVRPSASKYVTISMQLAYQVRALLLRQRIMFSFLKTDARGIHKKSYSIYVKERESIQKLSGIVGSAIKNKPKMKNIHKSWFDENYFYTPISRIDRSIYKGLIYNLEVDGSHSYVSEAAALHNCGDIMRLYIKVDEKEIITDAKFKTFGCGAAIATSSMVTELIKGKTIEEALKVSNHAVAEALGGLPKIKMHCSVLAEQALKSAIDDYIAKKKAKVSSQ